MPQTDNSFLHLILLKKQYYNYRDIEEFYLLDITLHNYCCENPKSYSEIT
jgi:hypothetical protein